MFVAVSPTAIEADGKSTPTVVAVVTDAWPEPIAGEPVAITTSDPGVGVGPVTDRGDGSYTATLTSSAVAHTVTVTATDRKLAAAATLTQQLNSRALFMGALPAGSHGALVALRCINGGSGLPCVGSVSLTLGSAHTPVTIGRAIFDLRAGASATISVSLSTHGRLLLSRTHGRLTVTILLNGTEVRRVHLIAPSTRH